jgi:hypothetical protein
MEITMGLVKDAMDTANNEEHGIGRPYGTQRSDHVIEINRAPCTKMPQLRDCKAGQFVVVETGQFKGLLLFIHEREAITLDGSNRKWSLAGNTQMITDFVRPMLYGEFLTIKIGR